MLVSTNHGFVFYHIPKTGGSSFTTFVAPLLDASQPFAASDVEGWQRNHHDWTACSRSKTTLLIALSAL